MDILTLLKAAVDKVTSAFKIVSYPHHAVHDGEMYQSSYKSLEGSDVADNASIDILINTGADFIDHVTFVAAAGGDAELELFEYTEVSAPGTVIASNNMNRNGGKHPSTVVSIGPTIDADGFRFHNSLLPGGTGGNAAGGIARANTEWNYIPDTNYLARITNRSGNAKPMSVITQWYEKGV